MFGRTARTPLTRVLLAEAGAPAGAPGAAAQSPLLASPPSRPAASPSLAKESWWSEVPSRQSTGGSTVASETDFRLPPASSPDQAYEIRARRLTRVLEERGWRHFFTQAVGAPLAFASGLSLGAVLAVAVIFGSGLGINAAPPAMGMPPPEAAQEPYAVAMPPSEVPIAYMAAEPLDNSCLARHLVIPQGPQTFDACAFVIQSTDEVWNLRGDVEAAIEKYFHEEYLDAGSWGRRLIGKKALREAVLSEMRAFPDIKIHITDCVCRGNDNDGYKCAMPDVLTGTNLGPSAYGPPTGRFARWTGLVESLVKRNPVTGQWQYYAEWGVHDEWALIQQLGLDFARVPHPPINNEPLHDCSPLLSFGPEPIMDKDDTNDQKEHKAVKALI